MANAAFLAKNYADALAAYTAQIAADASDPVPLVNRAAAHAAMELHRKAVKDADAAIALHRGALRAYAIKAASLRALNKSGKAATALREGLAAGRDAGDALVYVELHRSLQELTDKKGGAGRAAAPAAASPPPPPPPPPPPAQVAAASSSAAAAAPAPTAPAAAAAAVAAVPAAVRAATLAAGSDASLQHRSGKRSTDQAIALGYLHVNSGRYGEATSLFGQLLAEQPRLVGARMGRGSARALQGDFRRAIADFTAALEVQPDLADAWKRRGQTRSAAGDAAGAMADLQRAAQLSGEGTGADADMHHEMGLAEHKAKDYEAGLLSLRRAASLEAGNRTTWNFIGLCESAVGDTAAAVKAFDRAIALAEEGGASFKEAWANRAQAHRDAGDGRRALRDFAQAVRLDPSSTQALHLQGLCRHGLGLHARALDSFNAALLHDPADANNRLLSGLCLHTMGALSEALVSYALLLEADAEHAAWFHREWARYLLRRLDGRLDGMSMDRDLDPYLKEAWCKRAKPSELLLARGAQLELQPPHPCEARGGAAKGDSSSSSSSASASAAAAAVAAAPPDVVLLRAPAAPDGALAAVLAATRGVGRLVQLDTPGFLRNARQHAMFGLAVLHTAQQLANHWASKSAGGAGSRVPTAGASSPHVGGGGGGGGGAHELGWRDAFDTAVKWRQLSEPNDPVLWIDRLAPEAFAEGFGLQTPMITGQTKVVRYYPYFAPAFALTKQLMLEQLTLTDGMRREIGLARDCAELHRIMAHDFWVVTPCHSIASRGRVMEGTRLTVVASAPKGFEFTIRIPGTPQRWAQYEAEMDEVWRQIEAERCGGRCQLPLSEDGLSRACELALTLFFYWLNFGPLTRGSAACGYALMYAVLAALGVRVEPWLRRGVQVDWEAILRPTPEAFIAEIKPQMLPFLKRDRPLLDGVPAVAETVRTVRDAISCLNIAAAQAEEEEEEDLKF